MTAELDEQQKMDGCYQNVWFPVTNTKNNQKQAIKNHFMFVYKQPSIVDALIHVKHWWLCFMKLPQEVTQCYDTENHKHAQENQPAALQPVSQRMLPPPEESSRSVFIQSYQK